MPNRPVPFDEILAYAAAYREAIAEGYPPPDGAPRRNAVTRVAAVMGVPMPRAKTRLETAAELGLDMPGWPAVSDAAQRATHLSYRDNGDPTYLAWLAERGPSGSHPPLRAPDGPEDDEPEEAPPSRGVALEAIRLRQENVRLRTRIGQLEDQVVRLDELYRASVGLHADPLPPPAWLARVPASGPDAPGVPMIDLCDWHIGETVDPEQVYGLNRFDEATADARVRRTIDRVLHLAFQHIARPEYPGAVVILGGDFVSGWLHEELVATDWCTPQQAARWSISRLRWAIARLREAFGRLVVVCVPGNHGRLMRRPPAKLGAYQSFDWMIYGVLQDALADDPAVTVIVPPDGECLIQVCGTRYLIMHGHELGVRGGDGIIGSIGPIMRGATKVGRAERSAGRDFDCLVLHHFHQHLWLPGVVVCGTLKGYDEYSRRERYGFEPPSQTLWFTHPKWGPNLPFRVFCEDPPARAGVPFVALPATNREGAP